MTFVNIWSKKKHWLSSVFVASTAPADIDLDSAIDNSVAYDGTPITDNDREIIKDFLKDYFANKK